METCTANTDLINIHKAYKKNVFLLSVQFMVACLEDMVKEFMRI